MNDEPRKLFGRPVYSMEEMKNRPFPYPTEPDPDCPNCQALADEREWLVNECARHLQDIIQIAGDPVTEKEAQKIVWERLVNRPRRNDD